jgi:hypothetical protein
VVRHHPVDPGACEQEIRCRYRLEYRASVVRGREDLSGEQLERQRVLDRSWAAAQRDLADSEFRAYLEQSLRRLDEKEPATSLTREEFLAQTKALDE